MPRYFINGVFQECTVFFETPVSKIAQPTTYRSTQLIDIQYCQTIDGKVLIYLSLKEKMWEKIPKGILNSHWVGVNPG